jgi:hypothetical protein
MSSTANSIKSIFYPLDVMSGSVDRFRDTFGGHWKIIESDSDISSEFVPLGPGDRGASLDIFFDTYSLAGRSVEEVPFFKYIVTNTDLATTASADLFFPSVKFPIRLIGDSSQIMNDAHWKAIVAGGSFGTSSYAGAVKRGNYVSTLFVNERPYNLYNAKNNDYENYTAYASYDIGYEYNYYLPKYQQYVNKKSLPIAQIPSYYQLLSYYLGFADEMNTDVVDSIDYYGEKSDLCSSLFDTLSTPYMPEYDIQNSDLAFADGSYTTSNFLDRIENFQSYITASYVNTTLSSSTLGQIGEKSFTQIFNSISQENLFFESGEQNVKHLSMPFMSKIKIPTHERKELNNYIVESESENLILSLLKRTFIDTPQNEENPMVTFKTNTNWVSGATDNSGILTEFALFDNINYRNCNLTQMLRNVIEGGPTTTINNFDILGGQNFETQIMNNFNDNYRYCHRAAATNLLGRLDYFFKYDIDGAASYYYKNVEDFLNLAGQQSHSEVLAYRIEKKAITNVREISQVKPVQNFLLWNSPSIQDGSDDGQFVFYDSQVKYNTPYTYTVYAYIAVQQLNYSYSDLSVTQTLASASADTNYCLQFQKIATSESTPQLLLTDANLLESEFATNQITSDYRYLADFHLSIEPSIMIYEVPIANKTVQITDYAPSKVDVTPYQQKDNSQIIGFLIQREAPAHATYPSPILPAEFMERTRYLKSNNLNSSEKLPIFSRSAPTRVQVFRRSEKPTKITDFKRANLIFEKTLKLHESKFNASNCIYEQKIPTNTKFYYMFRFVSQNDVPGPPSAVIEAELVNDGGYKFATFQSFTEEELLTENNKQNSIQFKKLLQFLPNAVHTEFDDSEVDYENPAAVEINNLTVGPTDNNLWGKMFKVRLTSKKTGKKIDFNITYNLKER